MTTKPPELRLADYIRSIQDFPKPGILFRDVTPLLANPAAFRLAAVEMADPFRSEKVEVVAGAEREVSSSPPPWRVESALAGPDPQAGQVAVSR